MKTIAQENLEQLRDLLLVISKENYNKKPDVLSGASIGQHIRHILEFYLLLISGSFEGRICYDKRERNLELEIKGIYLIEENEPLQVEGDFTSSGEQENIIKSSVARELAYCIEHSIHHQALIKAGLIALELKDLTNEHFGVAYSTIRYRNNSCAQ
jgi:uncharacterized damage-inducible protein DinB